MKFNHVFLQLGATIENPEVKGDFMWADGSILSQYSKWWCPGIFNIRYSTNYFKINYFFTLAEPDFSYANEFCLQFR